MMVGAPVPTQRSFLMTGIVLLAVVLDRTALSMRLVAWAAAIVLAVAPESLLGPSFQMSFGAVIALIAFYRSEEHTSELQSLMRISYAVFCLKKKKHKNTIQKSMN